MFRAGRRHGKLCDVPRILVVDDERMVALMIRRTLEDAHEVVVEHSLRSAVGRLSAGERFDVMIADLHLEDGDAIALRERLSAIDRALPARLLILTGGAANAAESRFLADPAVRWVQKPFRAQELRERVEDVLRSAATA
jgi:DNA-binding response OmpR family regulator